MSMTKKQHYVPQFYMKYWLHNGSKDIRYLNIENKRLGYCSPKSICYEEDLYEIGKINSNYVCQNKFENMYGELETNISKKLSKLFSVMDVNGGSVLIFNKEEKELLQKFVLTTFLRNKELDKTSFLDNVYDTDLKLYQDTIKLIFPDQVDDSIVKNIANNFAIFPYINQGEDNILGGLLYRPLEEFIKPLYMVVLRSDDYFIFSDAPVCLKKNIIYMPLSPKYAVMYSNYKEVACYRNRIYDISYKDAMKCNRTYLLDVVGYQCSYLYAQDNDKGKQILENLKMQLEHKNNGDFK